MISYMTFIFFEEKYSSCAFYFNLVQLTLIFKSLREEREKKSNWCIWLLTFNNIHCRWTPPSVENVVQVNRITEGISDSGKSFNAVRHELLVLLGKLLNRTNNVLWIFQRKLARFYTVVVKKKKKKVNSLSFSLPSQLWWKSDY